jgi:type I restriction enzyme S subunit
MPSEESQRKIVAYLDEKSASIDGRVVVLEKKLSAYKRLKTSIINRAVTRGLDPKAKLKDSREVWIDKVPIGWTVGRFKDIATVRANLVAPDYYMDYPQIAPEHIEKGTGKLLSCGTVRESGIISGNHLFRKGQIIYSKIRPILNKLVVADFDGLCSADMYPIDVLGNLRFVFYQMLSPLFVNQVAAIVGMRVKMPKINQEELSAIGMVIPPLPEQRAIADYLDAECAKIDKMAELVTREIELYKKLKRSLINEVVTGRRPVFADKPLRRSKEVA